MPETKEYREILDEMTSETVRIYRDYPELDVWECIDITTRILKYKYGRSEIVEGDA